MSLLYQHLLGRCCIPSKYHCALNEDANLATFFLYDFGGNLAGYQQYRPNAPKTREGKGMHPRDLRYFTYMTEGRQGVFGWDKMNPALKTLYVVEGIFDSVVIHNLQLNCIATLSNDPKPLMNQLSLLPYRLVGVLDNDEAGRNLAKYCDEVLVCPSKDPAAMSGQELKRFLGV